MLYSSNILYDMSLLRPIAMLYGTDNIMQNIPHTQVDCGNIM